MDPATMAKLGKLAGGTGGKKEKKEKEKVEPNIKYNAGTQGNEAISAMIQKRNNSGEMDPILALLKKKKEAIEGVV